MIVTVSGTMVVNCSSNSYSVAAGAFDGACTDPIRDMHQFAVTQVSTRLICSMHTQHSGCQSGRIALYVEDACSCATL